MTMQIFISLILCILLVSCSLCLTIISLIEKKFVRSFFSLISFLIFTSVLFSIDRKKERNFKPLYHVDPKQDNYIILNGEQYDTVPHGHLEDYIMNDNL